MRIVQISDTHLCHEGGVPARNFARIAAFVNEQLRPDLVINTGDVIALTPDAPHDRVAAAAAHELLDAPLRMLAGNHDVGEPGERPWMGLGISSERVAAHRESFGVDRFLERHGPWAIVGVSSELMGSGLPEEDEQWEWLAQALSASDHRSLLLFIHKPLWLAREGESAAALCIPDRARERLLELGGERLAAVGCGHLHRFRRRVRPDLLEGWAPSTAFTGQAVEEQPSHFEQLGVVEWRLEEDRVDAWFRAPVDLEEHEVTDIPELAAMLARLRDGAGAQPLAATPPAAR
jgi:3',5'-cyclic AMP phosphodiesterase CpdA